MVLSGINVPRRGDLLMPAKNPHRLKRISLYPLTITEALKKILAAPPMPKMDSKAKARKKRDAHD